MFVYNIKINGSKTFKSLFIGIVLLAIIILAVVCFKIFHGANNSTEISGCLPQNKISILSASNYTNVLKTVHENIDNYIGIQINFTGYIYRLFDFNENQFVLARNMIISSDFQYVIVGFLCECENAQDFTDETWIELTGTITKGNYHGDMPIVKVTEIEKIDKPTDEFVYPPDESYIPTSGIV